MVRKKEKPHPSWGAATAIQIVLDTTTTWGESPPAVFRLASAAYGYDALAEQQPSASAATLVASVLAFVPWLG